MVALPPCFFCKINSASGRVRWPHFMNDGNLLRPSIYLNPRHHYAPPPRPTLSLLRPPCSRRQGFSNLSCLEKNTLPSASLALRPLPSTHKLYTHLHSSILCLLKEINNCVFCSACVDLHTHSHTTLAFVCFPFFLPSSPLPELSSLVKMIDVRQGFLLCFGHDDIL